MKQLQRCAETMCPDLSQKLPLHTKHYPMTKFKTEADPESKQKKVKPIQKYTPTNKTMKANMQTHNIELTAAKKAGVGKNKIVSRGNDRHRSKIKNKQ